MRVYYWIKKGLHGKRMRTQKVWRSYIKIALNTILKFNFDFRTAILIFEQQNIVSTSILKTNQRRVVTQPCLFNKLEVSQFNAIGKSPLPGNYSQ